MALTHDATDAWSRVQARLCVDRPCTARVLSMLFLGVALVVGLVALLPDSTEARWLVALALGVALAYVCYRSFEQGVLATFGWLLVLGLARRLLSTFQADPASDPLLLVAPGLVAVLSVIAAARGALRWPTWLAWGVIALSLLAIVEAFNPTQDRVTAGIRGLLFWLVPMLWFWIGRVASERLAERVLRLVAVTAGLAGAYGLVQALVGFPPWDQQWIDQRGYIALQISGPDTLRQFGFSSSAGEYALVLTIGVLVCALMLAHAWQATPRSWSRLGWPLAGIAVMLPALLFASVRTAVVLLVLALVVVFVVARGWGSAVAVGVGAAALAGLWFVVSRIDTDRMDDHGPSGMVRRTVRGLADPFGRDSTLSTHVEYFKEGVRLAVERPFGIGTSGGTPAGRGFENDVANGGLAFGVLGLVGVVWCLFFGFLMAYRAVVRSRGLVSLATLGVLILSLRFWWNGAHYAPAALLWFLLGWADAVASRPVGRHFRALGSMALPADLP
jgi:hypothetical protein